MIMAHQCLNIPEVLTLAFGGLRSKKDLLSAALTCHTFLEPALDNLWRAIYLFEPLLACLPPDLWEYREEVDSLSIVERKVAHLLRELTADDLERYLEFYAHRIRTVQAVALWPAVAPSAEFFQALQAATDFQLGALSPRIVQFVWTAGTLRTFLFPPLFLGPKVIKLRLDLKADAHGQVTLLRYLLKQLPRLKELDVTIWDHSSGKASHHNCGYLDSLPWDHLETVTLCGLSDDAIRRLSSLPRLTTLVLSGLQKISAIVSQQTGQDNGFKYLRKISISSTLRNVTHFLQRLPPQNRVERLWATWFYGSDEDPPSSEENVARIQLFINAVQLHMNPVTFQSLHVVDFMDSIHEEPLGLTRVTADISPLFIFKKLKKVDFSFRDGIWLTPEQTSAIPTAWPNIRSFCLQNSYDSRIPRVNHIHLLELAYRCPTLLSLGFPFDASQVNGEERHLAPAGLAHPCLQNLFVGHSPIESPDEVVSFLMFHFPELSMLHYDDSMDPLTKYSRRWEEVADAIG